MDAELIQVRQDICRECPAPCATYLAGQIAHHDPCARCPQDVWHHIDGHGCECAECPRPEPTLPSLGTMIFNMAQASREEVVATFRGVAAISEEEALRRHTICQTNACGRYIASSDRCSACGCYMATKTAWRSQSCPLSLW